MHENVHESNDERAQVNEDSETSHLIAGLVVSQLEKMRY